MHEPITYYNKSIDQSLDHLDSTAKGLTSQVAQERLTQYGRNEIREGKKKSLLDIFIDQFRDILIWILIFAAIISAVTSDYTEAILIIVILVLNSIFGVYQEWKADKAIESLKKMTTFACIVVRDGENHKIPSGELVPGDIIIIEQGDRVPADARIITKDDLKIEESALTGESNDVLKEATQTYDQGTSLADRKNMIYMGTYVTFGRAKAVVTSTGMQTEMGKIAGSVQAIEEGKTPFQIKNEEFGTQLGYGILALSAIIIVMGTFLTGELTFERFLMMLEIGVSLAVAAIPEGLPIIITLVLALGVQKMARKNAIVKKLPVVESLGSATLIATDKTGTLTQNKMTVTEVKWIDQQQNYTLSRDDSFPQVLNQNTKRLYQAAILCNNANINKNNELGEPTEKALLHEAEHRGLSISDYKQKYKRIKEVPFDSERKRMTVLVGEDNGYVALMKGAPDILLDIIGKYHNGTEILDLTPEVREKLKQMNEKMASQALRVLAFAYLPLKHQDQDLKSVESQFIFTGFMGMIDPPKDGIKEAIQKAKHAGIRVVMATGDHKITAAAIGRDIGIVQDLDDPILTGSEIDQLDQDQFREKIGETNIFARISPSHKLRIMQAFKERGEIVAMTGDGVNDAPALKGADIGISMGIAGTDVTKETADMILADDNFATIITAVEEGRSIFDNMSRFIRYMLSSNLAEILVVFLGLIFAWPIPLVAVQILFINLMTDGLPALALSAEPAEENIMTRAPREKDAPLLDNYTLFYILRIAGYITFATLFMYWYADFNNNPIRASTVAFSTLVFAQLFNSLNLRHKTKSVLNRSSFDNWILILAILFSVVLQLFIVEGDRLFGIIFGGSFSGTPIGNAFNTVGLDLITWIEIVLISFGTILIEEVYKFKIRNSN